MPKPDFSVLEQGCGRKSKSMGGGFFFWGGWKSKKNKKPRSFFKVNHQN